MTMDGGSIDERGWTIGRLAALVVKGIACLILLVVIVGAIYATVLPALTWHKLHPGKPGDTARPTR